MAKGTTHGLGVRKSVRKKTYKKVTAGKRSTPPTKKKVVKGTTKGKGKKKATKKKATKKKTAKKKAAKKK